MMTAAVWGFAQGTLPLSVFLYRCAFVFHSVNRITGNFIHISPLFTLWVVNSAECGHMYNISYEMTFLEYMKGVTVFYLVWAIPYYFIIFKLAWNRWNRK